MLLVDANNIAFRSYAIGGAERGASLFQGMIKKQNVPKNTIVCFDAGSYRRKEIDNSYKATRSDPKKEYLDFLNQQYQELQEKYHVIKIEGWEADDLISSLAFHYLKNYSDIQLTVLSSDHDLWSLICEQVQVLLPGKWQTVNINQVIQKFDIHPTRMNEYKALVGDKSDNILGVPGIGKKKAVEIINSGCEQKFWWEDCEENTLDEKLKKSLHGHKEQFEKALSLVQMYNDAPINYSLLPVPQKTEPVYHQESLF